METKQVTAQFLFDIFQENAPDMESKLNNAISQAFQEGRKQGLKEMDEALSGSLKLSLPDVQELVLLRKEYQS